MGFEEMQAVIRIDNLITPIKNHTKRASSDDSMALSDYALNELYELKQCFLVAS